VVSIADGATSAGRATGDGHAPDDEVVDGVYSLVAVVRGEFVGFAALRLLIDRRFVVVDVAVPTNNASLSAYSTDDPDVLLYQYPLAIHRDERTVLVDKMFIYVVSVLVVVNNVIMGCQLDLNAIKEVLKKPIGPAVGFVCQFCFMPLVSEMPSCFGGSY
jgi:sodium/bile acid cotransporter 3/5